MKKAEAQKALTGNRVRLRPKQEEDAPRDYRWSQDAELARLDASWPTNLSLDEYIARYGEELRWPAQGRYRFAIETRQGTHIGNCMFYDLDEGRRETELGILIGEREYWDQGYGAEALSLLLSHIFRTTGVNRVYLHTLEDNVRAQKCFLKCGFSLQGRHQREGFTFLVMDITRQQWEG